VSLVQAALDSGHRVRLRAGEQALDLLAGRFPVEGIRSIRRGVRGVVDFPARLREETRVLREFSPDLVVSDGDAPALAAARLLGLPALAVGHDLVFSRCRLPPLPLLPLLSCRSTAWMASATRRALAVHFLPTEPLDDGVMVARPAMPAPRETPADGAGALIAYFRDANGQRILDAIERLGAPVLAFGQGPRGFDGETFPAYLQGASAVITSAGSNVLAECVLLEKPVLALHRRGDHEQALNALLLERSGAGMRATFEEVTSATLATFWRRVQSGDFPKIPLAARLPDLISAFRDHALSRL
jgi:hypothetical protein